jgi:acetoacetyl-CoA synthetase
VSSSDVLWSPTDEAVRAANLTRYSRRLQEQQGLQFGGYDDLWRWSVWYSEFAARSGR